MAKKNTPTTKSTEVKENGDKLSQNAVKTLKALAKGPLTRTQLSTKTGVKKGWSKLLGAPTKGDAAGLEGRGYVTSAKKEDSKGMVYSITPAGKTALEAAK